MTFPTTAWSMFDESATERPEERLAAMNRFIVAYWRPIYRYLRAKRYPHEAAEDLTQDFLLKVLDRGWLARADAARAGRFRNFLLTVLNRFLADQGPTRAPRQKRFDSDLVPVSTLMRNEERSFEPPDNELPEELFMKHWAQSLVEDARHKLEIWCLQRGRPDWYAIFTAHHFPPPGVDALSQQAISEHFRSSRDQVRYALEQTNAQFARLFREAVAGQVGSEAEIEAEIREIERLIAR